MTDINIVNFVRIMQGIRPLEARNHVYRQNSQFSRFLRRKPTSLSRSKWNLAGPLLPAKFHLNRCNIRVASAGRKPEKSAPE